jgi:hypothetical protein
VRAKLPLYLYYVKNGDTLLARLPIITGMLPLEEAKLPDDRKRLEAEAFLKGIQSEVLDLVVKRKILESRIKTRLDSKKIAEAQTSMEELKRLKSYDKLFSEVDAIQRKVLVSDGVTRANPNLVTKVETMVSSTREMIQKWLQSSSINELEKRLEQAK